MIVRPAEPEDAMAVARVHIRSWQVGYRNIVPDDYLNSLRPEDRAARYTFGDPDPRRPATLVATEAGVICGFTTTAPAQESDAPDTGEVYALYVDPDWWGRSVGAALIAAARARLVTLGFRHAVLWVLTGNTRAERFYRNDGWQADGSSRTVTLWGVTVDELRYRRDLLVPG